MIHLPGGSSPGSREPPRLAFLFLASATAGWHFDWDTVPLEFLAVTHQINEVGVEHSDELGPGYPDSDFFRFELAENSPSQVRVLRFSGNLGGAPIRIGEVEIPMVRDYEIVTVPAIDHWVSVGPSATRRKRQSQLQLRGQKRTTLR